MLVRDEIRSLPNYSYKSRSAEVKLDQNESPEEIPDSIKTALLTKMQTVPFHRYPDLGTEQLRRAIGKRFDWPESGVVVSGGSNVLIRAVAIAGGIGRSIVSVKPTFPIYADQARQLSANLVEIPLNSDFSLPIKQLSIPLAKHIGVFFLANPAAPTGNSFHPDEVEELARLTANRWIFVIDEAYHQFAGISALPLVKKYPHVVSLRTFSKAYGLAGLRVGFALAQPELVAELSKIIMPFSVSTLQVIAAETALELEDLFSERLETTISERTRVSAGLKDLGLNPYPSATNFILFRVPDAGSVFRGLLHHGILIRRQDHLERLEGALRVTVGTPNQNDHFLKALNIVLGGESHD
jgi:histidinol-phosphate aminotransferase